MATPEIGPGWETNRRALPARMGCVVLAVAVVGFLAVLLWPVGRFLRDIGQRKQCVDNLRRIGLALHMYNAEWECLPPAYAVGDDGRRMHSWRVLLLPHLGEETLYRRYRFDEPWDSPDNLDVARRMPRVFRCPDDWQAGPCDTSYAMSVGPGAFSQGPTSPAFEEIPHSGRLLIAVVETSGLAIRWTQPRDLETETMSYVINDTAAIAPRSNHPDGAVFLFADGSLHFLAEPDCWSDPTSPDKLRDLITGNGEKWLVPW